MLIFLLSGPNWESSSSSLFEKKDVEQEQKELNLDEKMATALYLIIIAHQLVLTKQRKIPMWLFSPWTRAKHDKVTLYFPVPAILR